METKKRDHSRLIAFAVVSLLIFLGYIGYSEYRESRQTDLIENLYRELENQRMQFLRCVVEDGEEPPEGCDEPISISPDELTDSAPGVVIQGPPGPPPSEERIQEAIEEYCASSGLCVGPPGEDAQPLEITCSDDVIYVNEQRIAEVVSCED